tara:strand:- start:8255 stop:8653 length:399 start_codon:yes stop_codon:yes gene_type:complete
MPDQEQLQKLMDTVSTLLDLVNSKMGALEAAHLEDRGDMREVKFSQVAMTKSVERLERIVVHGNGAEPLTQIHRTLSRDIADMKLDISSIKKAANLRAEADKEFQRQMKLKVIDRVLAIIGAVGVAAIALFK